MSGRIVSLDALVGLIPDGAFLVIPPEYGGCAMAVTRALIRRGAKGLRLLTLPASSLQADLLIGAGCVAEIETSAVSLGEFGPAPRFAAAVTGGTIKLRDATCPALHAGITAAERGAPFMPMRGLIGSDVLAQRPEWRVVQNPFAADEDPVVLIPALKPEIALFHAPLADRNGNVWIGRRRELMSMAHAAERTLVTVEEIVEDDLLADAGHAAGTIPGFYVEAVAVAERGAAPMPLAERYPSDAGHIAEYARLAATEDGFQRYLDLHVRDVRRAA
jgi:glutaconate CoA-transferase, subunit A